MTVKEETDCRREPILAKRWSINWAILLVEKEIISLKVYPLGPFLPHPRHFL
jgi:hypothetical protein